MNTAVYILKINIAITVCYIAYMLFFRNDAFLRGKRVLLLSMVAFSLMYPFLTMFHGMFNSLFSGGLATNINSYGEIFLDEVVVMAKMEKQTGTIVLLQYLPTIIAGLYLAGVAVMLMRFLLQVISLIYQLFTAQPTFFGNTKIYEKSGLETPFSFFDYIVLDPKRYDSSELSEIMQHETAHCRQRHTIDLLASELMCAVCWFNPFAWLLSRETRLNLEYLADRSALEAGCNSEHYQFHLLRLTYNKAIATITNNFNVSQLKKRIIMINKSKKSNKIGAKYLLVLPLAALLLCLNNFTISGNEPATPQQQTKTPPANFGKPVITVEGNIIYSLVEVMPTFPGGEKALIRYIAENLIYPVQSQKNGDQGVVVVQFVVNANGSVSNVKIEKSVSPELDSEAARVVKNMPKWQPGKQSGETVAVCYNLPVRFKLQNGQTPKEKDEPVIAENQLKEIVVVGYGQ